MGLAILGAAFRFTQLGAWKSDVAIAGLLVYVSCFAFGLGPIFWLLISEIYPLKNRGVAMSAVTVTNWAMNMVVAVSFLTLVSVLGQAGTFLAVRFNCDRSLDLLLQARAGNKGEEPRADRSALALGKSA